MTLSCARVQDLRPVHRHDLSISEFFLELAVRKFCAPGPLWRMVTERKVMSAYCPPSRDGYLSGYGFPWLEIVAIVPSNLVRRIVKGSL
jgi:hypothetical protein